LNITRIFIVTISYSNNYQNIISFNVAA